MTLSHVAVSGEAGSDEWELELGYWAQSLQKWWQVLRRRDPGNQLYDFHLKPMKI
jgi:hypothetical protein